MIFNFFLEGYSKMIFYINTFDPLFVPEESEIIIFTSNNFEPFTNIHTCFVAVTPNDLSLIDLFHIVLYLIHQFDSVTII